MAPTSVAPTARTLEVPGARLYYEVRGQGPLVVLVGAPMDARSFGPLAELLAGDHTVLTTDPRGIKRSPVDDPGQDSTPEMRADDLSRLVACADAGPAVVLGSSGGAVSALALVQADKQAIADTTFQNTHMLRPLRGFCPTMPPCARRTRGSWSVSVRRPRARYATVRPGR
jgi:pimeloyl-ACP methyl ester carboxylesterase